MFKLLSHFPSFLKVPSLHLMQSSRPEQNSQFGEQANYYNHYNYYFFLKVLKIKHNV